MADKAMQFTCMVMNIDDVFHIHHSTKISVAIIGSGPTVYPRESEWNIFTPQRSMIPHIVIDKSDSLPDGMIPLIPSLFGVNALGIYKANSVQLSVYFVNPYPCILRDSWQSNVRINSVVRINVRRTKNDIRCPLSHLKIPFPLRHRCYCRWRKFRIVTTILHLRFDKMMLWKSVYDYCVRYFLANPYNPRVMMDNETS